MVLSVAFGEVFRCVFPVSGFQQVSDDVESRLLVSIQLAVAAGEEGFGIGAAGDGSMLSGSDRGEEHKSEGRRDSVHTQLYRLFGLVRQVKCKRIGR